jgi:chromate reductase
MTTTPRILAFAGSLRTGSYNKKLVRVAATGAERAGAEVTVIDLADFDLPIYNGDLEDRDGIPADAMRLKEMFRDHHGLLISAPEYNSSITAALKNAIDWVSRPEEGRPPLDCFDGKVAGLVAASPGALGGLRGLVHVRAILGNIRVTVIPQQFALSMANEAFNDDNSLRDDKTRKKVEAVGASVAAMLIKLLS